MVTDQSDFWALQTKKQLDEMLKHFTKNIYTNDLDFRYIKRKHNFDADLLLLSLFYMSPAITATMTSEIKEAKRLNQS